MSPEEQAGQYYSVSEDNVSIGTYSIWKDASEAYDVQWSIDDELIFTYNFGYSSMYKKAEDGSDFFNNLF